MFVLAYTIKFDVKKSPGQMLGEMLIVFVCLWTCLSHVLFVGQASACENPAPPSLWPPQLT